MRVERIWKSAAIAALLVTVTACAKGQRERPLPTASIESGAGTLSDARKFLEGRWALESFEVHPPGKAPIMLKGSGVLDYDDFGNLTMELRADQASSDLLRAAGIDIRDGVVSTKGRTAIDLQNKTLTYSLEGQSSSRMRGTAKRCCSLSGAPESAASGVSEGRTTSGRVTLTIGIGWLIGSTSAIGACWTVATDSRMTASSPTILSSSASERSMRARAARCATSLRVRSGMRASLWALPERPVPGMSLGLGAQVVAGATT